MKHARYWDRVQTWRTTSEKQEWIQFESLFTLLYLVKKYSKHTEILFTL